jgi:hypothetical protein
VPENGGIRGMVIYITPGAGEYSTPIRTVRYFDNQVTIPIMNCLQVLCHPDLVPDNYCVVYIAVNIRYRRFVLLAATRQINYPGNNGSDYSRR